MKITFVGAGSTVFCKNVLGDVLLTPALKEDLTIALYDIDAGRLKESYAVVENLNRRYNDGRAKVELYAGLSKDARHFWALTLW